MNSILDQILTQKKTEIQTLYSTYGLAYFEEGIEERHELPPRPFRFSQALQGPGLSLIAEIKRASPSRGLIRESFDPVELAAGFQKQGASALSVLTDTIFFKGDPSYIQKIKQKVTLPILRKDFLIDPIQILESKYLGSDAVLLIKAALSVERCEELLLLSRKYGMDVVLEIHTEKELEDSASLSPCYCLGINNRDLISFTVDLGVAPRLLNKLKKGPSFPLVIAESGYTSLPQIQDLQNHGFSGVLIGEGLAVNPEIVSYFQKFPKDSAKAKW